MVIAVTSQQEVAGSILRSSNLQAICVEFAYSHHVSVAFPPTVQIHAVRCLSLYLATDLRPVRVFSVSGLDGYFCSSVMCASEMHE